MKRFLAFSVIDCNVLTNCFYNPVNLKTGGPSMLKIMQKMLPNKSGFKSNCHLWLQRVQICTFTNFGHNWSFFGSWVAFKNDIIISADFIEFTLHWNGVPGHLVAGVFDVCFSQVWPGSFWPIFIRIELNFQFFFSVFIW